MDWKYFFYYKWYRYVDWRYSEVVEKALGVIREVFIEDVEVKLNFEEGPEFLQAKGIRSNFSQGTRMGFENQFEHR